MRDVQLVGEDEELFEAEGSVGVDPVVHGGVVGNLVWSRPGLVTNSILFS